EEKVSYRDLRFPAARFCFARFDNFARRGAGNCPLFCIETRGGFGRLRPKASGYRKRQTRLVRSRPPLLWLRPAARYSIEAAANNIAGKLRLRLRPPYVSQRCSNELSSLS